MKAAWQGHRCPWSTLLEGGMARAQVSLGPWSTPWTKDTRAQDDLLQDDTPFNTSQALREGNPGQGGQPWPGCMQLQAQVWLSKDHVSVSGGLQEMRVREGRQDSHPSRRTPVHRLTRQWGTRLCCPVFLICLSCFVLFCFVRRQVHALDCLWRQGDSGLRPEGPPPARGRRLP